MTRRVVVDPHGLTDSQVIAIARMLQDYRLLHISQGGVLGRGDDAVVDAFERESSRLRAARAD